jgi:hypothetical protein
LVTNVTANGTTGQQIDFDNARPGSGTTLNLFASLNPTNHLALSLVQNQRWLHVDDAAGTRQRLFIARVSRLRATYTFTARTFVRGIAQYVSTDRDPTLYLDAAAVPHSANFGGQVLLAYKLNWQSVMFVGYGDNRELADTGRLEKLDRQFFVKLSYALQR